MKVLYTDISSWQRRKYDFRVQMILESELFRSPFFLELLNGYVGGGELTQNIEKMGGEGTSEFIFQALRSIAENDHNKTRF